jgi:ferritin-like metal-binding protein YciE
MTPEDDMAETPNNLKDLFLHTLKDIYYAENQIVKALPKMAQKASSSELKKGFEEHLKQTKEQIKRLDQVFKMCGEKASGEQCPGIDGILEEGEELMKEIKDNDTRDAAMIAAAQAVEHYEIARYGALVFWAGLLNMPEARNLLRDTLAEEKDTDSKLNRLAEDKLNQKAA